MSERCDLVVVVSILPIVVRQRLEVAESFADNLERRDIESFFREFPVLFFESLAMHYPLDADLLGRYANVWNWDRVLMNSQIIWTKELVIACRTYINWTGLSERGPINEFPWETQEMRVLDSPQFWFYLSNFGNIQCPSAYDEFADRMDFGALSKRDACKLCFVHEIAKFKDRWDWQALSANSSLHWSPEFIAEFRDRWSWITLSENESLPWTIELIAEFESFWDWEVLSSNSALPWSHELLDRFLPRWDWAWVTMAIGTNCMDMPNAPASNWRWTADSIAHYQDHWDWQYLSNRTELPWSIELIDQYAERWDWLNLSINESLPWTLGLIEQYLERWSFCGNADCGGLSQNEALPWTDNLLEKFETEWDWDYLSSNKALPWSVELIEKYIANWLFGSFDGSPSYVPMDAEVGLSGNRGIPWSIELIDKYVEQWDWTQLSRNFGCQLSDAMLEKYSDRIDFRRPSFLSYREWSDTTIERYHGQINFNWIMVGRSLSRNLYRQFSDKFDIYVTATQSFQIEKLDKTQIEVMLVELAPPRRRETDGRNFTEMRNQEENKN